MGKKLLVTGILLLGVLSVFSQRTYKWWNETHNWDGCTNWYYYLKFAPKYLGPNALPVPKVTQGQLSSEASLETSAVLHFSEGDNTQNLLGRFYWPIAQGKAAVEVWGVPVEHYHFDTITRDERAARDYDGKGYASGDVHVNSYFQLVEDHDQWPDILFRVYLRAPSGNGVEGARYTDAPGYAFDLSSHKTWTISKATRLKWFIMGGFYFWQTNKRNKQNDAYLYGTGLSFTHRKTIAKAALAGYSGYANKGDRPLLLRGSIEHALSKRMALKVAFQQGLHDFPYSTFRFTGKFYFQPKAKKSAE